MPRKQPESDGPRPLFRFDAGWLYLVPGCAILAATVLMPGLDDLAVAETYRDKGLALESYRANRLENHLTYLDTLKRGDETLLLSLAASQLNLAPADREPIIIPIAGPHTDASVFPALDAQYMAPPPREPTSSTLHRLATDRHTRLWLIAAGAVAVLYGLLPVASVRTRP